MGCVGNSEDVKYIICFFFIAINSQTYCWEQMIEVTGYNSYFKSLLELFDKKKTNG